MLPSGCAIMHCTLYAQLFLQPQLILHRERTASTVTQLLRLQRVLHKEKSLVKMGAMARCDSILLTHSHDGYYTWQVIVIIIMSRIFAEFSTRISLTSL
jgi:hypothetical protein